ncbi:hypothetical protein ABM133_11765 [Enterococcus cecorum]|uniref:hypothetical protein n=1 Tax=Enterococcus cecorum TaxID=44008 RepID=UPI0032C4175B
MKILTNKLNIHYDLKKIDRDFDFFQIICDSNSLDVVDRSEFGTDKIESIVFEDETTFYIMCQKNSLSKYDLNNIESGYDAQDFRAVCVSCDVLVEKHRLFQLFLNALSNYHTKSLKYNNVTGKLYITNHKLVVKKYQNEVNQFDAVEVSVTENGVLSFVARRFNSVKNKHLMKLSEKDLMIMTKFELLSNGTLKRKRKGDFSDCFVKKSINREKPSIPFIDISSFENFNASKLGIIAEVFENLTFNFQDYVQFDLIEVESDYQYPVQTHCFQVENHLEDLSVPIYLINLVNDEQSELRIESIENELLSKYGIKCKKVKHLNKKGMNIVYIHQKKYYAARFQDDSYVHNPSYLIQHLTVEDFDESKEVILKNIVKELLIKKDIENQRLSLFNWQQLTYANPWIFFIKESKNSEKYFVMKIWPNGSFEMSEFVYQEYNQYAEILSPNDVEGLIINQYDQINVIKKTDQYSLQAFPKIRKIYKEIESNPKYPINDLLEILTKVKKTAKTEALITEILSVEDYLRNLNTTEISQQYFVQKLHHKTLKQKVNDYFVMNYQKHLFPYFRNQQNKSEIYRGSLDIHYWQIDEKRAQYCVGEKSKNPKQKMDKGVIIREVQAIGDAPVFFDELLPLMDVDFVRLGSLTVLPFPFKYLREYAKKCK